MTSTPVLGLATADTSEITFPEQIELLTFCQEGFIFNWEQPLPAPDHVVSVARDPLGFRVREVPPTPTTEENEAGAPTPYPLSPLEAVTAIPRFEAFK
jgi:hypothetical protein